MSLYTIKLRLIRLLTTLKVQYSSRASYIMTLRVQQLNHRTDKKKPTKIFAYVIQCQIDKEMVSSNDKASFSLQKQPKIWRNANFHWTTGMMITNENSRFIFSSKQKNHMLYTPRTSRACEYYIHVYLFTDYEVDSCSIGVQLAIALIASTYLQICFLVRPTRIE